MINAPPGEIWKYIYIGLNYFQIALLIAYTFYNFHLQE